MIKRYTSKNRRKFSLKVHLIFVTKYRRPLLSGILEECVKDKITELCLRHEWEIVAMETDRDHIHLLLCYDATERVID
jgi:putative transposase